MAAKIHNGGLKIMKIWGLFHTNSARNYRKGKKYVKNISTKS